MCADPATRAGSGIELVASRNIIVQRALYHQIEDHFKCSLGVVMIFTHRSALLKIATLNTAYLYCGASRTKFQRLEATVKHIHKGCVARSLRGFGLGGQGRASQLLSLFFLTGMIFFPLSLAWGQVVVNGAITGTVADTSGAVIPGVALTLTNIGASAKATAQSHAAGSYQFPNLPPAQCRLDAQKEGFTHFTREPEMFDRGRASAHATLISFPPLYSQQQAASKGVTYFKKE